MHTQYQNAKKQTNTFTHNCTIRMCLHDAKCKMKIDKKIATLFCQLFNENKRDQHRAQTQLTKEMIAKK